MSRFLVAFFVSVVASFSVAAQTAVNTVITDGKRPFSEGVLVGYIVQAKGREICRNPIAYGRYISCNGKATKRVYVETNGVLGAYIVVDKSGRKVCSDPHVSNQFRGPDSYIICQ